MGRASNMRGIIATGRCAVNVLDKRESAGRAVKPEEIFKNEDADYKYLKPRAGPWLSEILYVRLQRPLSKRLKKMMVISIALPRDVLKSIM
jgi:hypothetical protein